uniref:WRKY domain-containing protein n=1 Tax=Salix viminalis TaxID=40686 RepID=A0A6N2MXY2_SALVM
MSSLTGETDSFQLSMSSGFHFTQPSAGKPPLSSSSTKRKCDSMDGAALKCDSSSGRCHCSKKRGYYKCSSVRGCPACKHVERALDDSMMLIVIYAGEHHHSHPFGDAPVESS